MKIAFLESNKVIDFRPGFLLGGSNGAKLYKHPEEEKQQYCIKFYNSELEARNEVLTEKLYALAGVNVADVWLVQDGNGSYGVASQYVESFKTAEAKPFKH